MGVLEDRIQQFRTFLAEASHNEAKFDKQLYLMTGIVETFYEFVARVLDGKVRSREDQAPLLKKLRDDGTIALTQYAIMNETRDLRNKLLHDLTYSPDVPKLVALVKACFDEDWSPAHTAGLSDAAAIEFQMTHQVIRGYCVIDNQLQRQIWDALGRLHP